jgi:hypothetical protein
MLTDGNGYFVYRKELAVRQAVAGRAAALAASCRVLLRRQLGQQFLKVVARPQWGEARVLLHVGGALPPGGDRLPEDLQS